MRYMTTTDPTHTIRSAYPEDPSPMSQTLHQNDIHDLVQDRIGDLYATASELRADPPPCARDRSRPRHADALVDRAPSRLDRPDGRRHPRLTRGPVAGR